MNAMPFILLGVLLNAGAQLLLKAGMNRIGAFAFSWANLLPIGSKVALSPFVVTGLVCYVISVGVWLVALSRVQVSYAYPMLSLGYVINAVAAYYLFHEDLSFMRLTGIFVIIVGVYMMSRS